MGYTVIKINPDRDLYGIWSSFWDSFSALGDRAYVIEQLYELDDRKPDRIPDNERPEARINRADNTGSSARWPSTTHPAFGWTDEGWVYQQQGHLPRARLQELCDRLLEAGNFDVDVTDLLDAFDDEEPPTRSSLTGTTAGKDLDRHAGVIDLVDGQMQVRTVAVPIRKGEELKVGSDGLLYPATHPTPEPRR